MDGKNGKPFPPSIRRRLVSNRYRRHQPNSLYLWAFWFSCCSCYADNSYGCALSSLRRRKIRAFCPPGLSSYCYGEHAPFCCRGGVCSIFSEAHLPSRRYSLCDLEEFRKASRDAYFVVVSCKDRETSEKATRFLTELGGEHVSRN